MLTFVGTVWSIGEGWTGTFLLSGLSSAVPQFLDSLITSPPTMAAIGVGLGLILFPLGWILFCVATLRSKMFSRWSCSFVIVGVLLIPFLPIVANLLLGAGWAWMGYSVWATASAGEQAKE